MTNILFVKSFNLIFSPIVFFFSLLCQREYRDRSTMHCTLQCTTTTTPTSSHKFQIIPSPWYPSVSFVDQLPSLLHPATTARRYPPVVTAHTGPPNPGENSSSPTPCEGTGQDP